MNARYYPDDDLLVLRMSEQPYEHAEKIGPLIIHYTGKGEPVALEILQAAQFLREAAGALPYQTVAELFRR